jgi:hypothetical protein
MLGGVLGALAILSVWLIGSQYRRSRGLKLPPGPPGHPLIGHLLKIPQHGVDLFFHELKKTYGVQIFIR